MASMHETCCWESVQVWRGYSQSLRFEQLGLALNVDMAVSAFLEHGPVIDFLQRAAGLHDPRAFAHARPQQIGKASRAIFGVKVSFVHACLHLTHSLQKHEVPLCHVNFVETP